jgi:hypothetical protein
LYLRKAGAIVSIQIQLLTSSSIASSTPALIFLFLGITSELVGVIVIVSFARFPANPRDNASRSTIMRGVSEIPTVLILIGIICLAATLVVEMLGISVGTAVAMSGVLFLGVFFCLLAWWVGIGGKVARPDQTFC